MDHSKDIATQMMTFYQKTASKRGGGGWRTVGQMIGCSGAYARQLAMGKKPMTASVAGEWMIATGELPRLVEVEPCPIHGIPHVAGPCSQDGPVVAVVTLAPGETVRKAPRQPAPELARIMRAFSKLQPQSASGGRYDRYGRRR